MVSTQWADITIISIRMITLTTGTPDWNLTLLNHLGPSLLPGHSDLANLVDLAPGAPTRTMGMVCSHGVVGRMESVDSDLDGQPKLPLLDLLTSNHHLI